MKEELTDEIINSIPELNDIVDKFDERALARESLKMFMLYTDPYAQSP